MRYITTVTISKTDSGSGGKIVQWAFLPVGMTDCTEHHIFVVSQKHFDIRHEHNFAENSDAVGIPVNYVAQDVKCILWLKIDLFQNGIKAPCIAVDVRRDINQTTASLRKMVA